MSGSSGNIYGPSGSDLNAQNQQYQNLSGGLANSANSVSNVAGQAQGLGTQVTQNPYVQQAQTGANNASAYGTGTVVPQQQAGSASLQALGGQNAGYVPQALAQGFDPQNANYNRLFQQNQDQQNATAAMNGVAGTPYAAGVANQGNTNFNLDWLNQALGRQATAAGTASTLSGAANNAYSGASNLGQQAITTGAQAGALPSSTYEQQIQQQLQGLAGQDTATAGAAGIQDQALQQILSYLGYGTGATQAQQQQSNQTFQGIGGLLGMSTGGGGNVLGDALGWAGL